MQDSQQLKKIGLLILVAVALGLFFYSRPKSANRPTDAVKSAPKVGDEVEEKELMTEDVVEIEMSNFKFSQDELTVVVGQEVTIKLTSLEGLHNFVIDELGVTSKQISAGGEAFITFTIPKSSAGKTYEYYCGISNHRQLGMVGKLVVAE